MAEYLERWSQAGRAGFDSRGFFAVTGMQIAVFGLSRDTPLAKNKGLYGILRCQLCVYKAWYSTSILAQRRVSGGSCAYFNIVV